MEIPSLDTLTPALVLTLAGGSIVSSIFTGVILSVWNPTDETKARLGSLLALVVGIVVVVGFGLLQHSTNFAGNLLTGILVGGGGIGAHEVKKAVVR